MNPNKRPAPSPWLTPFRADVMGGLREKINQFDDGKVTILSPKRLPTQNVDGTSAIPTNAEIPVCIPVVAGSITVAPVMDPYTTGTEITVSLFGGPSGTEPYTYAWYVNGALRGNDETLVFTLAQGDIMNINVDGLGICFIFCLVTNPCGGSTTDPSSSIPVQGDPP